MQKFGLVRWLMIVTVGQNSFALLFFPRKAKRSLHEKNKKSTEGLHHQLQIESDQRGINDLNR